MYGTLYLVATPIGNLEDITFRAVKTLEEVDFIAAEDTRHSLILLNHFQIKKPMISYYEHNIRQRGALITEKIKQGENCALITDAGTPAISDPGEDIVKLCAEEGIRVVPVPGAVAGINGLIVSGLSTKRFSFEGFLSVNKKSRAEHLESVKNSTYTLIFYEAPHKLKNTLQDFYKTFGNRKISIARELTKKHEEILRFTLQEAIAHFEEVPPKGEFVLIVDGAEQQINENPLNELSIDAHITHYLNAGYDKKEAIKTVARDRGLSKRDVYAYTIKKE